jgi:hypothetical protein
MKIFITGLPEQADADRLKARMSEFGPVHEVHVLREGMADNPVWVVDMAVDAGRATEIALRIDNIWFQGRFIHAHVPPHQT